jgi:predicted RNase H-like HicB family nuclease
MRAATVYYCEESDGWWAESPDFPGLFGAGATFEETKSNIRDGLAALAADRYLGVRHLVCRSAPEPAPAVQDLETGLRGEGDLVLR